MALNEWINGYLEAILDAGSSGTSGRGRVKEAAVHGSTEEKSSSYNNNNIKKSVGKRFDEKVKFEKFEGKEKGAEKLFSPTQYFVEEVVNSFDETDLHRTWIKIASDDAQKLAKRRIELEKGRHDAAEDLSELSEGEKEKEEGNQTEAPTEKIARIISVVQMWSEEKENNKSDAHYIVLISLHGLVRGENMELGRDSDTGGQVKYVVN